MNTPVSNGFYDVMVDIETTDTNPQFGAIIQIAAVRFDLKTQTIDSASMFDRCLRMAPNRRWEESTRDFWMGKNRAVYQGIQARMEDPGVVLKAFVDWTNVNNMEGEPLRFWAKPTHFDYGFLASYFEQYGMLNPYHFRFATDMNSYIRGLANDTMAELYYAKATGPAHNAIVDTLNQIGNLFAAVNHHRPPAEEAEDA